MPPTTFIFAGGGTGGHLFPGLAIAESLRRGAPSDAPIRCLFLCSNRPLDTRILTEHHADFRILPAQPLGLHPRRLARFLANWGTSIREARAVIRAVRAAGPVHLVAMGGFVAAPAVQAARVERIPITLINLDAVPGKANRWIARRATHVFTAAPVADPAGRFARWEAVPPIVRAAAIAPPDRRACRQRLGLSPDHPVLMVTGGSQGARSINDFIRAFVGSPDGTSLFRATHPASDGGWQVLHQTGADADLAGFYSSRHIRAVVRPFVENMADWWGAADLAVARAGAGNVAEVWANRVPALFLPYPFHRDQHQRLNARPIEQAGGAVVCTDLIGPDKNLRTVGPVLAQTMRTGIPRMRSALLRLGPADGADRIAKALLSAVP